LITVTRLAEVVGDEDASGYKVPAASQRVRHGAESIYGADVRFVFRKLLRLLIVRRATRRRRF